MSTAMPKVRAYPVCSECRAPYVLRHAIFVFDAQMKATPGKWVWQRDCKHKKAVPLSSASPRVHATGTHVDARSAK